MTGTVTQNNITTSACDLLLTNDTNVGILGFGAPDPALGSGSRCFRKAGFLGCFKDDAARDVFGTQVNTNSSSVADCRVKCASFKYFAIQNNDDCHCSAAPPSYEKLADSDCAICASDGTFNTQRCGGAYRNAVYISYGDDIKWGGGKGRQYFADSPDDPVNTTSVSTVFSSSVPTSVTQLHVATTRGLRYPGKYRLCYDARALFGNAAASSPTYALLNFAIRGPKSVGFHYPAGSKSPQFSSYYDNPYRDFVFEIGSVSDLSVQKFDLSIDFVDFDAYPHSDPDALLFLEEGCAAGHTGLAQSWLFEATNVSATAGKVRLNSIGVKLGPKTLTSASTRVEICYRLVDGGGGGGYAFVGAFNVSSGYLWDQVGNYTAIGAVAEDPGAYRIGTGEQLAVQVGVIVEEIRDLTFFSAVPVPLGIVVHAKVNESNSVC